MYALAMLRSGFLQGQSNSEHGCSFIDSQEDVVSQLAHARRSHSLRLQTAFRVPVARPSKLTRAAIISRSISTQQESTTALSNDKQTTGVVEFAL
jgi:hypothetical protein